MSVLARAVDTPQTLGIMPRTGRARALLSAIIIAVLVLVFSGSVARAADPTHSLEVTLSFPDRGLVDAEQLCLGLYPSRVTDYTAPPLQARCLDPGATTALFENIDPGDYVIAVPAIGSRLDPDRYQGQLVQTNLPDEPTLDAYGIDVELGLAQGFGGTSGQVRVNVFGCPPGTNGGGDATVWASECNAVANGIPLSLSGLGTIRDTSVNAVTGEIGRTSGRVEFTDLPVGAYQLGGKLPGNVASPAVFIQSSIEGGIKPVAGDESLAIRPSELVAVNVYLVLDGAKPESEPATPARETVLAGFVAPNVTGGLTAAEKQAMNDAANAATPIPGE